MEFKLLCRNIGLGLVMIALLGTIGCQTAPVVPMPTNTLVVPAASFTPSPTAPSQLPTVTPTTRILPTKTAAPQVRATSTEMEVAAQAVPAERAMLPTPAAPPFSVFSNIALRPMAATGRDPVALAMLAGRLYVACRTTNNVLVIEDGAVTGSVPVGKWPAALVVDSNKSRLYVANQGDDTVSVIENDRVVHTIVTEEEPAALVLLNDKLYVGSYFSSIIVAYDAENWEPLEQIELDGGGILVMSTDAKRIYAGMYGKTFILDPAPLAVREVVESNNYRTLGINAQLGRLYINNYESETNTQSLVALDSETGEMIVSAEIGGDSRGMAVNERDGRIYVTSSFKNAVYVLDGINHRTLFSVTVGLRPETALVDEATNRVYVANGKSHNVVVLDGERGDILNTIPLTMLPQQMALNERTGRVYVPNASTNSLFILEGEKIIAEVPVGIHPSDVAVDGSTGNIYVVNYVSENATVLDGNTHQTITTVPLNRAPEGAMVDEERRRVYVGNVMLDADTHDILHRVNVPDIYQGEQPPQKIVLGNDLLYIMSFNGVPGSNGGNIISAFAAETLAPTDFQGYFHRAADLIYDENMARLYVLQWQFTSFSQFKAHDIAANETIIGLDLLKYAYDLAFNPETQHIFIGLSREGAPHQLPVPEVLILDARGFGTVARAELSGNPGSIAVDATTGYVYVTDMEHGSIALLHDRAAPPPPTPIPTSTPTPYSTWTPEVQAQMVKTATPTPAPPEVPTWTPCPSVPELDAHLADIWAGRRDHLGCMVNEQEMFIAEEKFERGRMFWRNDSRYIYVLYDDGTWQGFADTWEEGMDEYSCREVSEPHTPPTPKRGFGRVWCSSEGIRNKIGMAVMEERGDTELVVDCNRGVLLKLDENNVYAIYDDGSWKKFGE